MQEHIRHYIYRLHMDGVYRRLLDGPPGQRKAIIATLALIFVVGMVFVVAYPRATTASEANVLANGSFEHGFQSIPGCGVVGMQWGCFTNGGAANYGFYDDQWDLVVADGKHSQLVELNTKGLAAADADRYAGIYQTVKVSKDAKYMFSMRGMIRTTDQDGDPWRYRVEVGWSQGPQADWRRVENWTDANWNTYYEQTKPGGLSDFRTGIMPGTDIITIYIRVWKKWGVPFEEVDVNLDSIALVGPTLSQGVGGPEAQSYRSAVRPAPQQAPEPMAPQQPSPEWQPMPTSPATCGGAELVYNGDFEYGFNRTAWGEVGRGWGAFTNGGAANYGFYDEEWEAVISGNSGQMSGKWDKWGMESGHGQLVEINSKGVYPSDPDRYAGIYQHISGLTPGATYRFSLRGLLRGEGNEDDPYRFEAQWGYSTGPESDWRNVQHWEAMDLGSIYPRTEPQSLGAYTARFRAPSSHIVLFIRGWKKWAISEVEMDFNLDDISLQSCDTAASAAPGHYEQPAAPMVCTHTVKSGDGLAAIAEKYDTSLQDLISANGIENANLIFVGQQLQIPSCQQRGQAPGSNVPAYVPEAVPYPTQRPESEPIYRPERPMPEVHDNVVVSGPEAQRAAAQGGAQTYTVKRGDSLSMIAEQHNIDVYTLASVNGISNPNIIYVGQNLRIP